MKNRPKGNSASIAEIIYRKTVNFAKNVVTQNSNCYGKNQINFLLGIVNHHILSISLTVEIVPFIAWVANSLPFSKDAFCIPGSLEEYTLSNRTI